MCEVQFSSWQPDTSLPAPLSLISVERTFQDVPLQVLSHFWSFLKLLRLKSQPAVSGSCFPLCAIPFHPTAEDTRPGLAACPSQDAGPGCPHRVHGGP